MKKRTSISLRDVYSAQVFGNLNLKHVAAEPPLYRLQTIVESLPAEQRNDLISAAIKAVDEIETRVQLPLPTEQVELIDSAYQQLERCGVPSGLYPKFWESIQKHYGTSSVDTRLVLLERAPKTSEAPTDPTKDRIVFDTGFRTSLQMPQMPRPVPWTWKGVIPRGSTTVLYGDYGSMKTSFLISLGMRIASGDSSFCDRALHPGTVLYVRAEDNVDFDIRYRAFVNAGITTDAVAFIDINKRIDLTKDEGRQWFINNLIKLFGPQSGWPNISLLVIDPLLRLCPEIDIMSDIACRRAIEAFDAIAEELGCAVVLVVHTPKDGGRKAYGSYALAAAASSSIGVRRTKTGVEIFCDRVKCGPPFPTIKLATRVVEVVTEEPDGDAECPNRVKQEKTSGLVIVEAKAGKSLGGGADPTEADKEGSHSHSRDTNSSLPDALLDFKWVETGETTQSLKSKSKLPTTTFYRRVKDLIEEKRVEKRGTLYFRTK